MDSRAAARPSGVDLAAREVASFRESVLAEVGRVVVGMGSVIERFLVALMAGGHVLFEGVPGTAKTTLVKTVSAALGVHFARLQFTPDLLPSDVTGTYVFDRNANDFVLKKGPIFCQILLVDEINRAPAKTQSALLEAMQERQVTIEGNTFPLPSPFLVLATQNPIEEEGVYRLPEAQLDRFLMRIPFHYPSREEEIEILSLHSRPTRPASAVLTPDRILEYQRRVEEVHVAPTIREYVVDVARRTREHPDLALGASPRAALCLVLAARARAFLAGQSFTTHHDVKEVAGVVLDHRLILRPEATIAGRRPEEIVAEVLAAVPVRDPEGARPGRGGKA
ncbi:MAG: MoxR family ATPase [Planctomycetes bacterium]|nr:MoxR family ATPase [Planctomycetota bacterium]